MNKTRKLLLLTLILLFVSIILLNNSQESFKGRIKEIKYSGTRTIIILEENKIPFIIFNNEILNLKEGNFVSIKGKEETYRNKKQIVVSEIKIIN